MFPAQIEQSRINEANDPGAVGNGHVCVDTDIDRRTTWTGALLLSNFYYTKLHTRAFLLPGLRNIFDYH